MDDLINIGCSFDWITPTWAFLRDLANGPVAHFGIQASAGWDRGDIRRLLNAHGVQVWGLMYNLDWTMLMFTVRRAQAAEAYRILYESGVPLMYSPVEVADD